jgi:multiple sugar transport system ATP-binding protein
VAEVVLDALARSFGATRALDGLSLTVPDGGFMVLLGPTGAGKTTTLRLVAGLDAPDAGDVRIGATSVLGLTPAQRDVAMVFQQYSLYPHMTVRENLAFPLRSPLLRWPEARIRARVGEVAEVLRISAKLDNRATRLSGGEMQRVSIGRALVRAPRVFLMDEPLSSLDAKLRAELRVELKRIHAELGATFLYVTHDQIEAMTMATVVGVLDAGRLEQVGTPREVYEDPVSVTVAARLGSPRLNLLPPDLFGPAPARAARLGLRPEGVRLGTGGAPATVARVERLGDQTRLHLALGPHAIVGLAPAATSLSPGDAVALRPEAPLWFDAEGRRIRGHHHA